MTIPQTILDVLSPAEAKELLTRLKVAALLRKKVTYRQITKETGAGAATIARVAKRLQNGSGAIYRSKTVPATPNHYSFGNSNVI